ncbi:Phenylacetaldoxime dehydratase [Cyphellophora attinorum]|uniref:Phenylacetaldoxime dehydratase n=1 Tax=Cyphellophora attinorum TaxID=1664694 RepID=A0A0N1GYQ4_9EURO|nr:Phenylacetaldoxime dehydratase [Phialophora attinorum]KPI35897.1 Phenylacetaldoxime dehydratase [Phialophora attinorum]
MACPGARLYPPKQPPKWKPPVPRWQLEFPQNIDKVHTLYIGIQSHASSDPALMKATEALVDLIDSINAPAHDSFVTETELGHDVPGSRVWVLYFLSQSDFDSAIAKLKPVPLVRRFGSSIGIWTESFTTPLARLETNYAGLHESPGLASLPGITREGHELSAYWGAARDRLPASANDLFAVPGTPVPDAATRAEADKDLNGTTSGHDVNEADRSHPISYNDTHSNGNGCHDELRTTKAATKTQSAKTTWHITDDLVTSPSDDPAIQSPSPSSRPRGLGQRLYGTNYENMCHIRSGQCWNQCPADEAAAYERPGGLQEKLMKGMTYLWTNAEDTGTLGLRWLRNVDTKSAGSKVSIQPMIINETCGAGFFRNLKDLEQWSSTSPSHMAIFTGAHKHAREWGDNRKFMTWHEVSVLKRGEARWEYVNCDPRTGVLKWVKMDGDAETLTLDD